MPGRLRVSGAARGAARRLRAFGSGLVDTLLRDNKVVPAVLAVLALFIFAWILVGALAAGGRDETVSNRANVARSDSEVAQAGEGSPAPGIERPDVDSYAAYESKDPFRQLLAPAAETTAPEPTAPEGPGTTAEDGGAGPDAGDGTGGRPANGGATRLTDPDGDGLSNREERRLGTDPQNPDSDGDGVPDGADDSDGGGTADGGAGRPGGAGDGGRSDRRGDLFDSGGDLYRPPAY